MEYYETGVLPTDTLEQQKEVLAMTDRICEKIIADYLDVLRKGIEITRANGKYVVSLPFVSWSGHFLEIEVRKRQGDYVVLSDMQNEIADLYLSGIRVSGRNRGIIQDIAEHYKLQVEDDEIIARVRFRDAGEAVHRLVQALIRVGDVSLLHRVTPIRETPIGRQVRKILYTAGIDPLAGRRAVLAGRIGKRHQVDFLVLNGRKSAIKTVEAKKGLRTRVHAFAFEFEDIHAADPKIDRIGVYDRDNEHWDEDLLAIAKATTDTVVAVQDDERLISRLQRPWE